MTDVVNLNQARKAKTRVDKAKTAQNNRIKFGRTKAEKHQDSAEQKAKSSALDGKETPDKTDN